MGNNKILKSIFLIFLLLFVFTATVFYLRRSKEGSPSNIQPRYTVDKENLVAEPARISEVKLGEGTEKVFYIETAENQKLEPLYPARTIFLRGNVSPSGIKYSEEELELNELLGVTGSPTIFIDGDKYQGQRSSNSIQQTTCEYFDDAPEECGNVLEETSDVVSGACE